MITFQSHSCEWGLIWLFLTRNASLETVIIALELVPVSKRLLSSDILQGNIDLPRLQAVSGKYISWPTHTWLAWAYLTWDQLNGPAIWFELENVLGVCSGQGPTPNGPKTICRKIAPLWFVSSHRERIKDTLTNWGLLGKFTHQSLNEG